MSGSHQARPRLQSFGPEVPPLLAQPVASRVPRGQRRRRTADVQVPHVPPRLPAARLSPGHDDSLLPSPFGPCPLGRHLRDFRHRVLEAPDHLGSSFQEAEETLITLTKSWVSAYRALCGPSTSERWRQRESGGPGNPVLLPVAWDAEPVSSSKGDRSLLSCLTPAQAPSPKTAIESQNRGASRGHFVLQGAMRTPGPPSPPPQPVSRVRQ